MNVRARKSQVSDGICTRCGLAIESVDHLFFKCNPVCRRWQALEQLTQASSLEGAIQGNLFNSIVRAIRLSKRKPEILVMVIEACRIAWNERTVAAFSHSYGRAPTWIVLQNMERRLKVMKDLTTSAKKVSQLDIALAELNRILAPWRPTNTDKTTVTIISEDE